MSNEIQAVSAQNEITQQLLMDYLKQTNSNLLPNEQAQFVAIASAFGLNPWKREIYAVAYGQGEKRKLSIIVGYETYLRRADSFPQYDGYDIEFANEDKTISCTCRVYRKDRSRPTVAKVYLNEYHQGNTMWNTKPKVMLEKVAICTALRRAFPSEMRGFPYAEDEMPAAEKLQQQGYTEVPAEVEKPAKAPLTDDEKTANFFNAMNKLASQNTELFWNIFKANGYNKIEEVPPEKRRDIHSAVKKLMEKAMTKEADNG